MNKFEQLRSAYLQSRSEIETYLRKCNTFIDNFIDKFVAYLGCERNQIIYDPESFDLEKTFCYFSFKLKLYSDEKDYRKGQLPLKFEINTAQDKWEIRLNEEINRLAKTHTIDPDTFDGVDNFYEFIFTITIDYYKNRLKYLSEPSFDDKKVGFLPGEK